LPTKSGDYCPDAGDLVWIDLDPTLDSEGVAVGDVDKCTAAVKRRQCDDFLPLAQRAKQQA
jgi:hypothetical protein